MSLKSIITTIKDLIDSNPLYNAFGEGNIWELDAKTDIKYPLVWIDYESNSHVINNGSLTLNFDVWFCDLVFDDESNELSIQSDTLETAIDFVKTLKANDNALGFYTKDGNFTAQLFSEQWNDKLAGTKLSIQVTVIGAGSDCNNIFKM